MSSNSPRQIPFREMLSSVLRDKVTSKDLDVLEAEFKKRYKDSFDGDIIAPRKSTLPETVDASRELETIIQGGLDQEAQRGVDTAQKYLPIRGERFDQSAKYYGDTVRAQTQAVSQILGKDWAGMQGDQRDFASGLHTTNTNYLSGRDDKLFAYLDRDQDLRRQQMTQDLVTKLAATGALLFS